MLEFGVDEITAVLQLADKNILRAIDWQDAAEKMIAIFAIKARFLDVLGEQKPITVLPQGYKIGYTFGDHNFYLALAYHPTQNSMGVVVKFSALALDYYTEQTGLKVYRLLQRVVDDFYSVRLSRVDLTVDYIDEDINVTEIYQQFIDGKICVFKDQVNEKTGEITFRKNKLKLQGFLNEGEVPTLYLGSVQSNARLRIYDKKREQIERKGSKYAKAQKSKNWVRFEGVFRHEFAHQISEHMMQITTDDELANLIACVMSQKFRIMYVNKGVVDCDTEYTQMLFDCISTAGLVLKAPSSRNYDLMRSLQYLLNGSGIMTFLYKVKVIWGDDAVGMMFAFLSDYLEAWRPNPDCKLWVTGNAKDYLYHYPDFESFLLSEDE